MLTRPARLWHAANKFACCVLLPRLVVAGMDGVLNGLIFGGLFGFIYGLMLPNLLDTAAWWEKPPSAGGFVAAAQGGMKPESFT